MLLYYYTIMQLFEGVFTSVFLARPRVDRLPTDPKPRQAKPSDAKPSQTKRGIESLLAMRLSEIAAELIHFCTTLQHFRHLSQKKSHMAAAWRQSTFRIALPYSTFERSIFTFALPYMTFERSIFTFALPYSTFERSIFIFALPYSTFECSIGRFSDF